MWFTLNPTLQSTKWNCVHNVSGVHAVRNPQQISTYIVVVNCMLSAKFVVYMCVCLCIFAFDESEWHVDGRAHCIRCVKRIVLNTGDSESSTELIVRWQCRDCLHIRWLCERCSRTPRCNPLQKACCHRLSEIQFTMHETMKGMSAVSIVFSAVAQQKFFVGLSDTLCTLWAVRLYRCALSLRHSFKLTIAKRFPFETMFLCVGWARCHRNRMPHACFEHKAHTHTHTIAIATGKIIIAIITFIACNIVAIYWNMGKYASSNVRNVLHCSLENGRLATLADYTNLCEMNWNGIQWTINCSKCKIWTTEIQLPFQLYRIIAFDKNDIFITVTDWRFANVWHLFRFYAIESRRSGKCLRNLLSSQITSAAAAIHFIHLYGLMSSDRHNVCWQCAHRQNRNLWHVRNAFANWFRSSQCARRRWLMHFDRCIFNVRIFFLSRNAKPSTDTT